MDKYLVPFCRANNKKVPKVTAFGSKDKILKKK